MSFLDQITVLILTYNEEDNLARTLSALRRFSEVVVLDSGSSDRTVDVVGEHPNARYVKRTFDTHARQWNHGLESCGIERPWILALDADYFLPEELVQEISLLPTSGDKVGYRVSFRYCIFGQALSASLYPPVIVLFRRDFAHYEQHGHTQRVLVQGLIGQLHSKIYHDDRKPLSRWLASQQKYATLEAVYLLSTPRAQLSRNDRIRLSGWPAPLLVFLYALIIKRCILDGWPGWHYVLQRTLAETMIALEIVDRRLHSKRSREGGVGRQ